MSRSRQRLWRHDLIAAAASVLIGLGVLMTVGADALASVSPNFVTRSGSQLLLDGQPFTFSGFNIYNANSDGWCRTEYNDTMIRDAFTEIGGGNAVVRAWFDQTLAITSPTTVSPTSADGQRVWTKFDQTVSAAHDLGIHLVVTLAGQWGDCGSKAPNGGNGSIGYKTAAWYGGGYTAPDGYLNNFYGPGYVSYRDWVAEVVNRYKDEPAIFAWQLMNEAEVKDSAASSECTAGGADILKSWATDVSGLIRGLDANHLISLGTIGSGQCGSSGSEYQSVHDIPTIDLCEYHDYTLDWLPSGFNGLDTRLQQCAALDKPLFVGESGIPRSFAFGLQDRADLYSHKFQAQLGAGVVGELVWQYAQQDAFPEQFDVYAGSGDPTIDAVFQARQPTVVPTPTPAHTPTPAPTPAPTQDESPAPPSDHTPPTVGTPLLAPATVNAGASLTVTATAADASGIVSAVVAFSPPEIPATAMGAADGSFGNATEDLTMTRSAPLLAGSYQVCVIATDAAGNASNGAACAPLSVLKLAQTITFANPGGHTILQTPFSVSPSASSDLPVTLASTTPAVCTVNGVDVTLVSLGTCTVRATQAGDGTYAAAPNVTRSFTVTKAAQTITFANPGGHTILQTPFSVSPSASSGLPVTLASTTPTICSVTGFDVTLLTTGTCTITASQPGNGTYAAAPNVTRSFTVTKAAQTVTFASPGNHTLAQSPFTVAAAASSGLPVSLTSTTQGVCTVSNFDVTLLTTGTCTITASQSGDGNYAAAPNVSRSFAVSKVAQTITFANPGPHTMLQSPFTVTATASSGLPVALSSTTAAVCSVAGFDVTLVAAGTCTIAASQAGDATTAPAPNLSRSFTVSRVAQTITFANPGAHTMAQSPFTVDASASTGLPVTVASTTEAVCTVSGFEVTLVGAGTCSLTASQNGDATYKPASLTRNFGVTKVTQTITFPPPGKQSLLQPTVLVSAVANTGRHVQIDSNSPAICTVAGDTVTLLAAGTCSLTASQAGNDIYKPATLTRTFAVAATYQLPFVTAQGTTLRVGGAAFLFNGAAVYHASSGNPQQTPEQAIAMASQAKLNSVRLSDILDQSGTNPNAPRREENWVIQDELIARARGAGMRVVLDLSSFRNYLVNRDVAANGVHCGQGEQRSAADYAAVDPYRPELNGEWHDFLDFVVNRVNTFTGVRYGDEATIAVISVAGEPHGSGTEDCGRATSPAELTHFYERTLGYLASIDPRHLRSNGGLTQTDWEDLGQGNSGIDGEAIFAIPENTLPSLHTYPPAYANDGTPIDYQTPHLGAYAISLGKPWFTEEFGWKQAKGDTKRADYYQWLYDEQVTYGSSGALLWNLGNEIGDDSHDVGPGTPKTWAVVRAN